MNSISWAIYVGGLGDNSARFGVLGTLAFFCAVGGTITWWVTNSPGAIEDKDAVYIRAIAKRSRWISWPTCIALWAIALLLPAKDTMYAIAASQVGERVINNAGVQGITNDATKALQQWLEKQIEPEKSK